MLLRYVNAGAQMHAMSVLGGSQTEIAQDGHPMAYPTTVDRREHRPGTDPGHPGHHADAVPEAKVAVYEPAEHLDNNGQNTADPLQFAFGGMLTFLDTNAPPPSTDGVGPVSSHVAARPTRPTGCRPSPSPADLSGRPHRRLDGQPGRVRGRRRGHHRTRLRRRR